MHCAVRITNLLGQLDMFSKFLSWFNIETMNMLKFVITIFALLDEQECHEFAFLEVIPK